jgi:dynein heavy chain 1
MDLKKEDERFRQKLNTDTLYSEWLATLSSFSPPITARMLLVDKQQRDGRQQLRLKVNFAPELIEFCKAVRTIRSMGMRPPFRVLNSAHQTSSIYPFAISLIQSVRDYQITHAMVTERSGAQILVASLRKELHTSLVNVCFEILLSPIEMI